MTTRSSGRKKQAKFFGIPPGLYHEGSKPKKTKDFSCKSRDGRELKIYLGTGCIPGNYGINDLLAKYPQFHIYDKTSLSSAFNRLKKNPILYHLNNLDPKIIRTMVSHILQNINLFDISIKSFYFDFFFQLLVLRHIPISTKMMMIVTTWMESHFLMMTFPSFVTLSQVSLRLMQQLRK